MKNNKWMNEVRLNYIVWIYIYVCIYTYIYNIRMISVGSCDTENWSNDVENSNRK